jgi:hypothetical protein
MDEVCHVERTFWNTVMFIWGMGHGNNIVKSFWNTVMFIWGNGAWGRVNAEPSLETL